MKTSALGIAGISGILLAACGGEAKNSQLTTPTAQDQASPEGHNPGAEAASRPVRADVSDWSSWTKINTERFYSKGHNNMWVDIYVPAEHAANYTDPSASLVGMKIVKAQYAKKDAPEPRNLTVMVRDESTESKWFWGVYDPGGIETLDAGQIDSCITCHDSATDMLFRPIE